MRIVPISISGSGSTLAVENRTSDLPEKPASLFAEKSDESIVARNREPFALDNILSSSRIIILEGISGSGKDTFQKYLKSKLRSRVVHDYSEGELLWSWKHQQIKDIFKMQIRLMRNFLDHVALTVQRDDRAIFLLNRFHLSTFAMYTTRITDRATLHREYNMVVKALRALPTHIFLLQLMEAEMEARSAHPERGRAWHQFQQHILQREGFGNFVKRNVILQKAMIEAAIRQNVPFSILRLPSTSNVDIAVRRLANAQITVNPPDAVLSPSHKNNPTKSPVDKLCSSDSEGDDAQFSI
jgi:thymidylate kinase